MSSVPRFVVVGHPNKGKSSLVATLSDDSGVGIGAEPGTTRKRATHTMTAGDTTLYHLVDTPGFQRARRVLAWLVENAQGPGDRPAAVARFVDAHRDDPQYVNEVELLTPLINTDEPAGVLYVVDGSVPYGPEYEPEMEILRYTGQPSLAIINPIGSADHLDEWRTALEQFFRIVRVLNAVQAPFEQRLELLRAFGQMRDEWRSPLNQAVDLLQARRDRQRQQSARIIAESVASMLHAQVSKRFTSETDVVTGEAKEKLRESLMSELRKTERTSRRSVEEVYEHHGLQRREDELDASTADTDQPTSAMQTDLFSQEAWLLFGLKTHHMVMVGAAGGAVTGGLIDLHTLGHSFLIGTVVGAASGAAAGWWSAGRLAEMPMSTRKILGGGTTVRCGPIKHGNFPFVVLNRALLHHELVAQRTHAMRGDLILSDDEKIEDKRGELDQLSDGQRKDAAKLFTKLRKSQGQAEKTAGLVDELSALIDQAMQRTADR